MFQPIYKVDSLIVGNPESPTGVVTLWTDRRRVASRLDNGHYAALGQLYSATRGLDYLVRNLLANPQIRYLILTGRDLSGSGLVLQDFFSQGIVRGQNNLGIECWLVKSKEKGYIDIEVAEGALTLLRQNVELIIQPDLERLADTLRGLPEHAPPYAEPLIFEKRYPAVESYPGEGVVYAVRGKKVAELWVKILRSILRFGRVNDSHYGGQKEILNLVSIVTEEDPAAIDFPDYLPVTREYLEDYLAEFLSGGPGHPGPTPPDSGVTYQYGPRLRRHFKTIDESGQEVAVDQVEAIVRKVTRELNTRSAVASLWDPRVDSLGGGTPCLNHIWIRLAGDRLYLTAIIRSNDMYGGWPVNAFALRSLQELFRERIVESTGVSLSLGELVIVSESAHLYDDCWEEAEAIVKEHYDRIIAEERPTRDPRGNFTIEVREDSIDVEHVAPATGEHLDFYQGKTAASLFRQLAAAQALSSVEHALYLGSELEKAEVALNHPQVFEYIQDRPLQRK